MSIKVDIEWISCDDLMPPQYTEVLFVTLEHCCVSMGFRRTHASAGTWYSHRYSPLHDKNVTHWAYIPSTPFDLELAELSETQGED